MGVVTNRANRASACNSSQWAACMMPCRLTEIALVHVKRQMTFSRSWLLPRSRGLADISCGCVTFFHRPSVCSRSLHSFNILFRFNMLAASVMLQQSLAPALAAVFVRGFHASTAQAARRHWFSHVELAPRDPILGVTERFLADENPSKVNLGVVGCCQGFLGSLRRHAAISALTSWVVPISLNVGPAKEQFDVSKMKRLHL